jgi:4-amino-4-deoxy-L-arabinose transferase-like glycosyltransferase
MMNQSVLPNIFLQVKKRWYLFVLAAIAVLSFGLNFYAIEKVGFGNAYYAAAIKSMTQSFHNFFFVSFDPAGLVSVDKPPLALWIQAIFVLIFGYHGWAMLLPQALAGTGSCIMMYALVAKHFGRPAGLISSLAFALTPAVVVAARNNTMDMQLIFVLLVATWFLFKAIETSKWRHLFLAAFFIGLGFNIKMLQAYMIIPAVGIVYLFFSKEKVVRRIIASAISIVIMLVVSFAWVAAVDLYPSSSRPYVGSSTNNTVMELIIGHNGMERISGQGGAGGRMGGGFSGSNDGNFGGRQQRMDGQGQPPQRNQQDGNIANNGNMNNGNTNNGNMNNGTPPAMPDQNNNNNNAGHSEVLVIVRK